MKPTAFKIACVIGSLLLALAIVLLVVNPRPQNNLPEGFFTPIIAFEFIQTPQEVHNFFQVKSVSTIENAMLMSNCIDYGFMFLYTGLLFCIAIGIRKISGANSMWIAIVLCLFMLLGDALENFQIYQIIQHYKNGDVSGNLAWLNLFTWIKWSSIASTFLLFSPFFFKGNILQKILGIFCVSCFGLCISAFLHHGMLNELFASSVVLVFLLLVIFVFTFKEKDQAQTSIVTV